MANERTGIVVDAATGPGVLHQLTGVIAAHQGDVASIEILEGRDGGSRIYFEIDLPGPPAALADGLRALPVVHGLALVNTFQAIYGKRVIIMGGGAQVGQVASAPSRKRTATTSAGSGSRWTRSRWWGSARWRTRCARWPACPGRASSCSRGR